MDEQAFRELYRSCYPHVARYVSRRLLPSGTTDPADVTATVFLTAWRRRREIPPDHALPWLYGVARLTLANELRARRRAVELHRSAAGEPAAAVSVDDHADAVVSGLAVAAAFDALPDGDQEVLRLVAWENLTVADAARVLGCSGATAAVRLHRARRRLRRLLDGADAPEAGTEPDGAKPGGAPRRVREGRDR